MSKVITVLMFFLVLSVQAQAAEPLIQQAGNCTAVATKVDPDKPAQVTTTCPNGQVTIQYPNGAVRIIQSSGQTIDIDPQKN